MSRKFITSQKGIDLIKQFEGLRLTAYNDPGDGTVTIGYGTTRIGGMPVVLGMKITKDEAEQLLRKDVSSFEKSVSKLVKTPINQEMFDALVSFVYNVGESNFKKSTLLRLLNDEKHQAVAEEFQRWKFAGGKALKGLLRRRQAESKLFLEGFNKLEILSSSNYKDDED